MESQQECILIFKIIKILTSLGKLSVSQGKFKYNRWKLVASIQQKLHTKIIPQLSLA